MRLIPTDTRNILIGLLFNLLKLSKKMCFFSTFVFLLGNFRQTATVWSNWCACHLWIGETNEYPLFIIWWRLKCVESSHSNHMAGNIIRVCIKDCVSFLVPFVFIRKFPYIQKHQMKKILLFVVVAKVFQVARAYREKKLTSYSFSVICGIGRVRHSRIRWRHTVNIANGIAKWFKVN